MPPRSTRTMVAATGLYNRRVLSAWGRNVSSSFDSLSVRNDGCGFPRFNNTNWQRFPPQRTFHERVAASQNEDYSVQKQNMDENVDDVDFDDDFDDESDYDDEDEERELPQDKQPWKILLELPSRASWRASDPNPPDDVVNAQIDILNAGGATAKQLRRTFEGITVSHKALAERRERERRRLLNNTYYSRRAQIRDEDVLPVFYGKLETLSYFRNRLNPNYAITKRVLEETKSLLGYNIVNQNENAWRPKRIIDMGIGVGSASAAALEVFGENVEWIHGIDPSRCMRECSKEFLEEIMEKMVEPDATSTASSAGNKDQHQRMNPPRLTLSGSIATETSSSTFDMALLTYTATELPHVASTMAAAGILWQKLSPNGIFVMIEPGTPDGFNSIRAVRNMLLDCCPPNPTEDNIDEDEEQWDSSSRTAVAEQCHIIAPCTHNGKCPMERYQRDFFKKKPPKTQYDVKELEEANTHDNNIIRNDLDDITDDDVTFNPAGVEETDFLGGRFCSFVQTMSTGNHLGKGEKFSYLVAQKRIPESSTTSNDAPHSSFQNERLRDLLAMVYQADQEPEISSDAALEQKQRLQVQDLFEQAQALATQYLDSHEDDLGLEFLHGDVNRSSFGRIIRAPIKKRGHVFIDYCAEPGRLMRSRVSKAVDYRVAPGLYTAARKSRWGGLWPDVATSNLGMSDRQESKHGKNPSNK